jgi:ribosomal-protein-alanine N-acetyltransferase
MSHQEEAMALPLPQTQATIRSATRRDLLGVLDIESRTFDHHWDRYQFQASLDDVFLVAEDLSDHRLMGYIIACCCALSRRGVILRVAVHPDYQRHGVATALLQAAFAHLRRLNLKEVDLDVDVLKAGARRLYEKVGFQVAEVISLDQEDDEESFYIMRRSLEGP